MQISTELRLVAAALLTLTQSGQAIEPPQPKSSSTMISPHIRAELFAAREAAWRAFFSEEPARLEMLLGRELIAIQGSQEAWEDRDRLVMLAHAIRKNKVRIARLEFPRTEVQVFGDVAILYYTYIFETAAGTRSATDAGRGTEIFVRRNGRWVDVGWHLDNGAFVQRNGNWQRLSPSPGAAS